jgi:hypothetical protein
MTVRPAWFRCDASRLLGALAGMGPDSGYLYTVILMRIYEVGGPILDDETMLSRRTGLNAKRVVSALAWLTAHGKVERLSDGRLDSVTTHAELAFREKTINDKRSAGKSAAKRKQIFEGQKPQSLQQNGAAAAQQNASTPSTEGQQTSIESDSDSESELEKKDSSEADASLVDGQAADPGPVVIEKPKKDREALRLFGEAWNQLAAALDFPAIEEIEAGSTRERHALARLRKMPPNGVQALMARIRGSPYLRGEVNGFRVSFDWIVNASNYQKIMEGNYEDRKIASLRR